MREPPPFCYGGVSRGIGGESRLQNGSGRERKGGERERERIWLKNGGDPAMANLAFPPFSRRCKQPLEDADGAKGKECKRNKQRERREREGENAGLCEKVCTSVSVRVFVRPCACVCKVKGLIRHRGLKDTSGS